MSNLFDDQILETIANKEGAYMVGGTIHVRTVEGPIDFCSCEEYELYVTDPVNYNFEENECAHKARITFCSATCDCCKLYQLESDQVFYDGNKRIIWTLRFEYESFWQFGTLLNQVESHRSCAKIQNWKQKSNGHWKRRRADLYARTYGTYYDSSDIKPCDPPSNYAKHKAQRRKVLEATNWYPLLNYYKAFKTGEAEGYWEWPGGASLHKTLDFPC